MKDEKDKVNYDCMFYCKDIVISHPKVAHNSSFCFSIELRGTFDDRPDCKIGNFAYNCWFRTNAGMNGEKYSSKKILQREVENLLKKKGFRIIGWIDKDKGT